MIIFGDNSTLQAIESKLDKIMIDLSNITAAVAAVEKAVNDGITEITTLIGQIGNTVDPNALAALQTRLNTAAANMEASVAAATGSSGAGTTTSGS